MLLVLTGGGRLGYLYYAYTILGKQYFKRSLGVEFSIGLVENSRSL